MMTTVWDQDRSVEQEGERDWNTTKVFAFSNTVMYKVQQSHGPQQSCRTSSLLRSEVSPKVVWTNKVVSPNLGFASQRSVAATKEQEQAGKKRWLESHYGEPRKTATDSARPDGDLYMLPGLPQALPIALARGQ